MAEAGPLTTTYPERGATRRGPLPAGYRHVRRRTRVGTGAEAYPRAVRDVLSWRMFEAMGVLVEASGDRAAPGASVVVRPSLGPLHVTARCVVVWVEQGRSRAGFGYGTTVDHPLRGEEAFVVTRDPDGTVWLEVASFSRPARWWTRLAWPLLRPFQHLYAHRCGTALRRLGAL